MTQIWEWSLCIFCDGERSNINNSGNGSQLGAYQIEEGESTRVQSSKTVMPALATISGAPMGGIMNNRSKMYSIVLFHLADTVEIEMNTFTKALETHSTKTVIKLG